MGPCALKTLGNVILSFYCEAWEDLGFLGISGECVSLDSTPDPDLEGMEEFVIFGRPLAVLRKVTPGVNF